VLVGAIATSTSTISALAVKYSSVEWLSILCLTTHRSEWPQHTGERLILLVTSKFDNARYPKNHHMLSRALYTKHRRPTRLSDPHYDFTPRSLAELLSLADEAMTWQHFTSLLGPHLPAGTYAETAYFFPRAVDYLLANHEAALDLVTPIVGFVSNNTAELRRDGLLVAARDALADCLASLTATFEVQHFESAACAAKGWRIPYFDYVTNLESVCHCTTDLVHFGEHVDLAEQFVDSLAHHHGDATRAAWFLAYARSVDDVYSPPDHAPIRARLLDESLLAAAAEIVRTTTASRVGSPTYWRDTFASLGLPPPTDA
jgi:hypothetical protein